MDPTGLTIGQMISWLRGQRTKLSSRGLSLAAGLSPSYVGKVEAGEIAPSLKAFGQLAQVLQMSEGEVYVVTMCAANAVTPVRQDGKQ